MTKKAKGAAESWKYTSLAPAEAVAWEAAARPVAVLDIAPASFPVSGRVVFYNGFLVESACFLPEGVRLSQDFHRDIHRDVHNKAGEEGGGDSRIAEMNAEYCQDSVTLTIAPRTAPLAPIEILFLARDNAEAGGAPIRLAPRLSVTCGAGAAVALVERHEGAGLTFSAVRVLIGLEEGARLDHLRIEAAAQEAILLEATEIAQEKRTQYQGFYYAGGARLSRNQISAFLAGEGADFRMSALALLRGSKTTDLTSFVRHAGPGALSSQKVRTVLDGPARGVYQGKIMVDPGADGTDARQNSRALLLSEGAEMDTKPELEILADDVKCAHGAATGAIDPNALFYLRSRGIPEREARALLISGFVSELVDLLPVSSLRAEIEDRTARWMAAEA